MAQHRRVKRGMTRTFQINTLFPGLTVLESVLLAVCERRGSGDRWLRPWRAMSAEIDEAMALLAAPAAGRRRGHADAQSRVRAPAPAGDCARAGDQAARAAARRAGSRHSRRRQRRAVRRAGGPAARGHRAVHRARHGTGVPLRRADHRAGGRPRADRRHAAAKSPPTRASRRFTWAKASMAELLRVDELSAGYGAASGPRPRVSFALQDGDSLALLGRNGMGKTTLLTTLMGFNRVFAGAIHWRGADLARVRAVSPRARRARLGAAGTARVSVADRARAPAGGRAPRRVDAAPGVRAVAAPRRAGGQFRQPALGRRAADAGDRPRAGDEPAPAAARRADGGARADRRAGADAGDPGAGRGRVAGHHHRRAARADGARRHAVGDWCWSVAGWSTGRRAPRCWTILRRSIGWSR